MILDPNSIPSFWNFKGGENPCLKPWKMAVSQSGKKY